MQGWSTCPMTDEKPAPGREHIDLSRDPNPGVADHAVSDGEEGSTGRHRRKPE